MIHIPIINNATTDGTGSVVDLVAEAGGDIQPIGLVTVTFNGGTGTEVLINTGSNINRTAPILTGHSLKLNELVITRDASFEIPIGLFLSATVRNYSSGNIYVDLGVTLT